ncbi:putative bromodomain-containing protein 10 [Microcaecilia unicolor]|uniref:Uncharacterized protein KIAA2026 homolog n=1 Tax=Microcaecilia unicolor TaxID=1415580 RepID=A0A6P7XAX6_9AMPH|nr:uncharacterized protein KIAA2026 homolog [Microcaecilia unicolor]
MDTGVAGGGGGSGSGEVPPETGIEEEAPRGGQRQEEEETVTVAGAKERGWEQELSPELRQGYRILSEFVQEKQRGLTAPFLQVAEEEAGEGAAIGLLGMEDKFVCGRYQGIGDFVADFRLMLENCYRRYGVDHWLSKQAQKVETMLEQKLALLSRSLREKTTIAVTSKGRYGLEDEKGTVCTSTRRRSTSRNLVGLTSGVFESIMIQVLRQEEQLRAKEEKRLREQERKEAEEVSQKEIEEWETNLLSQSMPTRMETMWEIPAIGHFLCLAQQILNLPEIVFYELERCLLMPQCSAFLSKIMTSLLSPPHRRPGLHRKPTLPYGIWEAALRQKVQQWYTVVGQAENPDTCAEKLGLSPEFFRVLGETSPLEEKPFHKLPFYQKVWLLKGLCDFVYETQSEVQDSVLGQPIHECREVILGYDSQENAYIHFPQFCGADIRIYKQRPFQAPEFPVQPIRIQRPPRIKLQKIKHECANKSNGEVQVIGEESLIPSPKIDLDVNFDSPECCPPDMEINGCSIPTGQEIRPSCEIKIYRTCDTKITGCCKENLKKLVCSGEMVGYGEPLSPGEVRIVENGEKYSETPLVKIEPSPLKENALKMCQVHVNGSHSDNLGLNCHRKARDIILEQSLLNHKKLKLAKVRVKKKKKKKKKLKDILNENPQEKWDGLQSHSLKSYKPEIQSTLFLIKKKTKHKKHKSGKKSVSKKAIVKKRKAVSKSPAVLQFQLVCTNLDELRELITKTEGELKDLEKNRKKSGKWYFRRQAVKELHNTLIRLLNELLPWELKLMKAFQKNRARMKKDYDDFKRQLDPDHFTTEVWSNEAEGALRKESPGAETSTILESSEYPEVLKKDHLDGLELSEMGFCTEKSKLMRKELFSKDVQRTLPKTLKRQCKQNIYLEGDAKDLSPRKKAKLSTIEVSDHGLEGRTETVCCLNEQRQTQPHPSEALMDSSTPISSVLKGTKAVQALLAKNIGNKVTLTNQLPSTLSRSLSSEKPVFCSVGLSPPKSTLPCQTNLKSPLQMVCKMPGGQCIPLDLHNSSVKIQEQPIIDPKTGEKLLQQVLILPKNFLIQHKEDKADIKEDQTLQQKIIEQHGATVSQAVNVNVSSATLIPTIAASQQSTTVLNKSSMHLTNVSILPSSPSITINNLCASAAKVSQNETGKTKNADLAITFPIASPIVTTTVQPPASTATLSESASAIASLHSLTPQEVNDSFEGRQELKTVCIRDSQSILVRTRGGNTGVVKVQTNLDHNSSSTLPPRTVFSYASQLQSFFMSKASTLPSTTFPSVTAAATTSPVQPVGQASAVTVSSPPSPSVNIPINFSPLVAKNFKFTLGQPGGCSNSGQLTNKHGQSPTVLPTISSTDSWLPATPSCPISLINISANSVSTVPSGNTRQNDAMISHSSSVQQQMDPKTKNLPVAQANNTVPTNGEVIGGASVQKLMLVSAPSVLTPSFATTVNMMAAPTSTVNSQKLVLINTPIPSGQSANNLVAESIKQALPSTIGKAYVQATEPSQIVLLPSSIGAQIKVHPSSTVSQVKDVKIGLNIGQAIVNNAGNAHAVSQVNLLQNVSSKGIDDKNGKGFILPLSTASNLVSGCSSIVIQNASTNDSVSAGPRCSNVVVTTAANSFLDSLTVTSSCMSVGTQSNVLNSGNEIPSRIMPVMTNRLCTPNIGNTVAKSTVKTGHLASSVLFSSTQPTVSPQSLPSTLQLPSTVTMPTSGISTPKGIPAASHLATVPSATPHLPPLQFQSLGIPSTVQTNTNVHISKALLPSSPNTNKIINLSKFTSLPSQQMSPNVIKSAHTNSGTPGLSSCIQTASASSTITSQLGNQLNETCIQQKLVLTTSTPLVPGTQIMINGVRFIVPPQGLGPGSHVLLISTNTKHGSTLVANHVQGAHCIPIGNPIVQNNSLAVSSSLAWHTLKQPLQSSTKIVNSLGIANTVPVLHSTPQVNTNAKASDLFPSAMVTVPFLPSSQSAYAEKTPVAPAVHIGKSQLASSTSEFNVDTAVKKLLVSPEGAILNTVNIPTSKVHLSPIVVSPTKSANTVFPIFHSPVSEKPSTTAS